jgi:steroid 5-alpha reductase family enzyme
MPILEATIAAFIFINLMFLWSYLDKNLSHIDIGWGLMFVVIAIASFSSQSYVESHHRIYLYLVSIWGIRLSAYLLKRNIGKPEDIRYTEMRKGWKGNHYFNAYYRVFLLQMALALLIMIPIYPLAITYNFTFGPVFYLGLALWGVGFLFEALGDHQKSKFKQNSENRGKICKVGLWKYTRHPNYFGEVTLWWGFWISMMPQVPLWTIIGPLLISFLILKVSGIPMLEESKKNDPEFQVYMKETNAFFPWFPKKVK